MPADLPTSSRIVVIGGGVGGASIAYHLTELGERDVVLVERSELTSGSTFHSAGLVGQLRADPTLTRMNIHSVELYRRLGDAVGWTECGGIRLASSPDRLAEIRQQISWARTFGLPLQEISPHEAQELFPLMSTDGVVGAAFLPSDGYLDPSQLCYALAGLARGGGVRIASHTRVTGIDVRDGRVYRVRTDRGDVDCEVVVDCGGMFAPQIARMTGVRQRAGAGRLPGRWPCDVRGLRLHGGSLDRVCLPAGARCDARRCGRGRSCSANGCAASSRRSRSTTPRASESGPDAAGQAGEDGLNPRSRAAASSRWSYATTTSASTSNADARWIASRLRNMRGVNRRASATTSASMGISSMPESAKSLSSNAATSSGRRARSARVTSTQASDEETCASPRCTPTAGSPPARWSGPRQPPALAARCCRRRHAR